MFPSKHPLASRTIWGGLVALASAAAGAFGYTIGPDDQEALVMALSGIGTAVGALLAVYGRVKATKGIG